MKKTKTSGISSYISSYYQNLPFGKKDEFVRDCADAIGKSSNSVRRKIILENWSKTELPVVLNLMKVRK